MRLQLALLPPGAEIRLHSDAGGYAAEGHRIHVVLQSNPGAEQMGIGMHPSSPTSPSPA